MKLQLAIDAMNSLKAIEIAEEAAPFVDIIEAGTPLVKYAGINIITELRTRFPHKMILADLKTMDAGAYECEPFFAAGADICTVLGAADEDTIAGVIAMACKYGKMAQVDLINVPEKIHAAMVLGRLGPHILGIHTGIDQQAKGMRPNEDLRNLREKLDHFSTWSPEHGGIKISVAGGIKWDTIGEIAKLGPDIIVVGGAITSAPSPRVAAKEIDNAWRRAVSEHN